MVMHKPGETVRTTVGDAVVRYFTAQHVLDDRGVASPAGAGETIPFFPYAMAIFGHGNALCIGDALEQQRDRITTLRGQNEQGMALAAVAYAKAARRRQALIVSPSIGPGSLNVVTAAGAAMVDRLPMLVLAGDTFASRDPEPVLQQIENFSDPSTTANDAFRPVTRYWDRIVRPEQLLSTLPQAMSVLLDPADCGPVLIALPQDVQAQAYDFPASFFEPVTHTIARPRPSLDQLEHAVSLLMGASRPLIVAGGGVHYSLAESELAAFATAHGIPVVETVAGRTSLLDDDPMFGGPIGICGTPGANALAESADVVLAVGTRLQDFTTGSWTAFQDPNLTLISINTARFDAVKRRGVAVVGDAKATLQEINAALGSWKADAAWSAQVLESKASNAAGILERTTDTGLAVPTYAQVVGAVHEAATADDYVLTAAGGLPGELNMNWAAKGIGTFDCEYGFSCMGYEISGTWGAALERAHSHPAATVFGMTGDGSFMMLPSDIYSAALHGTSLVLIVCDNGGFNVIERLQKGNGAASFRTMLAESDRPNPPMVDFTAAAAAFGANAVRVSTIPEFSSALAAAKSAGGVQVVVIEVAKDTWSEGGSWWEVGIPEVSPRPAVNEARARLVEGKKAQRAGW